VAGRKKPHGDVPELGAAQQIVRRHGIRL